MSTKLLSPTCTSVNHTQRSWVRSRCNKIELEITTEALECWFTLSSDGLKTNLTPCRSACHKCVAVTKSDCQSYKVTFIHWSRANTDRYYRSTSICDKRKKNTMRAGVVSEVPHIHRQSWRGKEEFLYRKKNTPSSMGGVHNVCANISVHHSSPTALVTVATLVELSVVICTQDNSADLLLKCSAGYIFDGS